MTASNGGKPPGPRGGSVPTPPFSTGGKPPDPRGGSAPTPPFDELVERAGALAVPGERHRAYGRSLEAARERTLGSDEANAQRVNPTAHSSDLVLRKIS